MNIKDNNPKVSIIIATYNSEKTLRRALDSVENQTLQSWECIVVDGASKDHTVDIAKELCGRDSRFAYISEPDKGIYDAFNKGWKMAKGEWIHYLGSDDELVPAGLEKLLERADNADLLYGNTYFRKPGATNLLYKKPAKPRKDDMICCHQSLIMRRKVIEKFGGFDMKYRISADKDLVCKALREKINIIYVDTPVSIFMTSGVSGSSYKIIIENYRIDRVYSSLPQAILRASISTLKFIYHKLGY